MQGWGRQGSFSYGKCRTEKSFPKQEGKSNSCLHDIVIVECSIIFYLRVLFLHDFFQIKKITETSLSANQERTEMERKRLVWKVEGSSEVEEPKVLRGGPIDPANFVVKLAPMEIRTFVIDFRY